MLLLFFIFLLSTESVALGAEIPEHEVLRYRISYLGIPAGEAILETKKDGNTREILIKAWSYPVIDAFYPVRITARSIFTLPDEKLIRYEKYAKEGFGREKTEYFTIDYNSKTLVYYKNDKEKKRIYIPEDIHDPFSCIYTYRRRSNSIGSMSLYITDGKKITKGTVQIYGSSKISTPAGVFDTVKVEPILEGVSGIFAKSPGSRLFVWLSNDQRMLPVRLSSSVSIGEFTATLIDTNYPDLRMKNNSFKE